MNGVYRLSGDFSESKYTAPLREGQIAREIVFVPSDPQLPNVAICTIHSSRADAEIILRALQE